MIDLTPLDVRKKKEDFKRAVRGYDAAQVDAFLDVVAERLEQLVTENRQLADRAKANEDQLSHYRERERALNEALLAAQELREEARSQAERDAAVRLREAETHAEAILLEADQAIRHSQRRLKEVRAHRSQLLRALRGVVHRVSETLEVEESRLDEEPEVMQDLLEKLEGESAAPEGEPPSRGGEAEARPSGGSGGTGASGPDRPAGERPAGRGDGRAGERPAGAPAPGDGVRAEESR